MVQVLFAAGHYCSTSVDQRTINGLRLTFAEAQLRKFPATRAESRLFESEVCVAQHEIAVEIEVCNEKEIWTIKFVDFKR
jgi:hypothetical protein